MNVESLPSASSAKLMPFNTAKVVPGFVNDTHFLVVTGEAPCANMEVQLVPRIYIDCPEHWAIEVVGTLPGGFCLTMMKPFVASIALSGVTGSTGIEVVGANRSEKISVSGGCSGGSRIKLA